MSVPSIPSLLTRADLGRSPRVRASVSAGTAAQVSQAVKRDDPEGFAAVAPYFTDTSWKVMAEASDVLRYMKGLEGYGAVNECELVNDQDLALDVGALLRKGALVLSHVDYVHPLDTTDWKATPKHVQLAPMVCYLKRCADTAPFLLKLVSDERIKEVLEEYGQNPAALVVDLGQLFASAHRRALYCQSVLDALPGDAVRALLPQHGWGEQLAGLDWDRDFNLERYSYVFGGALDANEARVLPFVNEWFQSWNRIWDYGAACFRMDAATSVDWLEEYLAWLDDAMSAWNPLDDDNVGILGVLTAAAPWLADGPDQATVYEWFASKRDDLAKIMGRARTIASSPCLSFGPPSSRAAVRRTPPYVTR